MITNLIKHLYFFTLWHLGIWILDNLFYTIFKAREGGTFSLLAQGSGGLKV